MKGHQLVKEDTAYDVVSTVARAQSGDATAFDTLFEHFADLMYQYILARCGDAHLAEDLTSELWVKVVEHLPTFRFRHMTSDLGFRAWLYRIARNLVYDYYRGSSQHTFLPLVETTVSSEMSLDDQVIQDEARHQLHELLKQLTVDQHEVVLLRFVQEHSIAEVAELTNRSKGAVKLLQYRALDALARKLEVQRKRKIIIKDQCGPTA